MFAFPFVRRGSRDLLQLIVLDAGREAGERGRSLLLLGDPPSWRFPVLLSLTATAVLGLLVTVTLLVGRMAAGTATLAPPILSRQPCILVLAALPAVLALLAARLRRGPRLRPSGATPARSTAVE
jgi:hypothetical protein